MIFRENNIQGDYTHPQELWEIVGEKFPGITYREYMRTIEIIQKVRFGGKELLPYEKHTLRCFHEHVILEWYKNSGRLKKAWLRYYYLVEIKEFC